jgi:hypothetical protein
MGRRRIHSNLRPTREPSIYYQPNESTIKLSRPGADRQGGERISFDAVTKEAAIHVTQEWSIDERKGEVPSATGVGRAV